MGRLEEVEARMRALEKEIFQLKRYGTDRFSVGDVIRFTKTRIIDGDEKTYTFAAIKTPMGWYTTGEANQRVSRKTYDDLIDFLIRYPAATNVEVAASWADVTSLEGLYEAAERKVDVSVAADASNWVSPSFIDEPSVRTTANSGGVSSSSPGKPVYDAMPMAEFRKMEEELD